MVKYELDEEEQEIINAFESGKIERIPNAQEEIRKHRKYAAETFKQDQKINICITSHHLSALQKLAILEGMPYQTFIASILHKFADGRYIKNSAVDGVEQRKTQQKLARYQALLCELRSKNFPCKHSQIEPSRVSNKKTVAH